MDMMRAMMVGAFQIAELGTEHSARHAAVGFSAEEWDLLTQKEMWTQEQRRMVRAPLAEAVSISLTLAGLPSEPLPGQYVAAVIAKLVAPANRLVAAFRAPETFDAVSASGLIGEGEVKAMTPQQMVSLVMYYSSGQYDDLQPDASRELREEALRQDKAA